MSSFPDDDRSLTNFLRQHRPAIPPASAELEEHVMALVAATPQAPEATRLRAAGEPDFAVVRQGARRWLWVVPSAIAAGLVAIVGYQAWWAPRAAEAQLAELETFIESTWHGTVAEQPTADQTPSELDVIYPLVDDPATN